MVDHCDDYNLFVLFCFVYNPDYSTILVYGLDDFYRCQIPDGIYPIESGSENIQAKWIGTLYSTHADNLSILYYIF